MRQIAVTRTAGVGFVRAMICTSGDGVYLFLYSDMADGPCDSDELFSSVLEARQRAAELLEIDEADWTTIEDTRPGCQDDWIAPVRTKRRSDGTPEYGRFEQWQAGVWVEDLRDQ